MVGTIVIIGGTGYLGRMLVEGLLKKYPECSILVVTRNLSKRLFYDDERVKLVPRLSDISEKNALLINLAYEQDIGFIKTKKMFDKLFNELKMFVQKNTPQKVIHISSIAVTGNVENIYSSYPSKLRKVSKESSYTYSKGLWENALIKTSSQFNVEMNIIRCGNIMGAGSTWAMKLAERMIEKKPIIANNKKYSSNTTFIGNLVFFIGELINYQWEDKENKLFIMNFAEFGDIPWNMWSDHFKEVLNVEPQKWLNDDIHYFRPNVKSDIKFLKNEIIKLSIPFVFKSKALHKITIKFFDFFNIQQIKDKSKNFIEVHKIDNTMDIFEYNMAKIYLNKNCFKLEGAPEIITKKLPFSFEQACKSMNQWLKYSGYKSISNF